jgi:hypothetical protein
VVTNDMIRSIFDVVCDHLGSTRRGQLRRPLSANGPLSKLPTKDAQIS